MKLKLYSILTAGCGINFRPLIRLHGLQGAGMEYLWRQSVRGHSRVSLHPANWSRRNTDVYSPPESGNGAWTYRDMRWRSRRSRHSSLSTFDIHVRLRRSYFPTAFNNFRYHTPPCFNLLATELYCETALSRKLNIERSYFYILFVDTDKISSM